MRELHVSTPQKPVVHYDNLSTINMTANPVLHARTKHLELDLFFVREKVQRKEIHVQHIESDYQLADGLTKPHSGPKFQMLRSRLQVISTDELSLREDHKKT